MNVSGTLLASAQEGVFITDVVYKSNNNASIDNITALPLVDLDITKKVNVTLVNVSDLIEYIITVVNNGPSNASDVVVSENMEIIRNY